MKLYFQKSLVNLMCHYNTIWVNKSKDGYNLQILLIVVQELSDNLPLAQT